MTLKDVVHNYIKLPFPIWEVEVTTALVDNKWNELRKYELYKPVDYITDKFINSYPIPFRNKFPIAENNGNEIVFLETTSFDNLSNFYNEHGLNPLLENELDLNDALIKLKSAIGILDLVKPIPSCISKLVRAVQIVKQENEEIDISYSHPGIPFSIFVSVCKDNSILSKLRVAESILHESMHLKLTLLENILLLIKPNTGNLFFSPWRQEKRPAQGVLHGIFVFRAILDFIIELQNNNFPEDATTYLDNRKQQIRNELLQLIEFSSCPDLTVEGEILTRNLLPLN